MKRWAEVSFLFWCAALVLMLVVVHGVGADDSPPKTTLTVCSGGLPSLSVRDNAQGGCHSVDVTATDVESADKILYEPQSFSHVYMSGGDPCCIFTGTRNAPDGGRDCRPEDSQCAYIAEGYVTWAVTGKSCQELGVPECGGLFCR